MSIRDIPDHILYQLGITLKEYDIIIASGYYIEMIATRIDTNSLNLYQEQPCCRIMMHSNIRQPSLTYTDHGTQDVDVTENVLKMIHNFR